MSVPKAPLFTLRATLALSLLLCQIDGASAQPAAPPPNAPGPSGPRGSQDLQPEPFDQSQPAPSRQIIAKPSATDQGVRVGSFNLDGGVAFAEYYDDNIFATRTDKHDDFVSLLSPYIRLRSAWARHELNFEASADLGRYAEHDEENYDDYNVGTDGRLDLGPSSNVFGGASFSHLHEGRESPDAVNGTNPTTFDDLQSYLGTLQQIGDLKVRLGGTFQRLDFDDVSALGGQINNDDRDRDIYEIGTRLSYPVGSAYDLFVQGAWNWRQYDSTLDDAGFHRDSHGTSLAGGLRYEVPNRIEAEVFAGYLWQTYDEARFHDIGAIDLGGLLRWRATPSTRLTGQVDRRVEETTLSGSPGYLYTVIRGGIDHDLRRDVTLGFDMSYGQSEYENSDRTDDLMAFGVGFKYFLTPNFFIGPEYRYIRRDSNVADANYDDNQIWLRLGAQVADGYDPTVPESSGPSNSGFYVGTQAEHGQLHTKLNGPRGAGGSLSTNFGDTGFGGGVFAGYGANIERWYLGVEADGGDAETNWAHSRLPGGRVFDVTRGPSYAVGVRAGYWLPRGALAYGRLGVARTEFDTNYRTSSGRLFEQDDDRYGIRFGVGLEAPLTDRLFARLDYTYTDYADYDVVLPSGTDTFKNSENLFRLGIGYRFNDAPSSGDQSLAPADYKGFYAGPLLGYSTLNTDNSGARQSGSTLVADRAGHGPDGGVVGGFGTLLGRWYVGAEVDASISGADWASTREETGRAYSVDKIWSLRPAVRVGYVLPHDTLIYGRVGPTWTRFNTEYRDEGGVNFVEQSDTLFGIHYGVGAEVPAGDRWFVRAEYTYVKYESYSVNYVTGVDDFADTTESLFNIGLVYRF